MQRVHWDPEFARRSGNPTTFDYGRMRETWLIHLCTDWMGDDAWLWKLDCEFRRVQLRGRHPVARGTVTNRYLAEGGRPAVDVDLAATNQRGELTTPGHATILLPSREHGAVRLPDPPGARPGPAGSAAGDQRPVRRRMSDPADHQSVPVDRRAAGRTGRPGAGARDRSPDQAQRPHRPDRPGDDRRAVGGGSR